ncbi:MAG: hypothetical protein ACKOCB_08635 [Planctomycetia bacterium]
MDRSFLSDSTVVRVSRDFVCVRLLTYEDAGEAQLLESLFRGRSGALENTVYALLGPDGSTRLSRTGRAPGMVYGGSGLLAVEAMVEEMAEARRRYPAKDAATSQPGALPHCVDVRRALDAAACDMLPLAVVVARDEASRAALEKSLRPLAWSEAFRGRFTWAPAKATSEIKGVAGVEAGATLVLVQPDAFGLEGKVLAQATEATPASLEKALATALARHDPGRKDARELIAEGRRAGVEWKTEVPITDPGGPPPGQRPGR